jgi:hypothetical protein
MTQQPTGDAAPPPDVIYIIRHGEKPADPPPAGPGQSPPAPLAPFGVDDQGNQDLHSLGRRSGRSTEGQPWPTTDTGTFGQAEDGVHVQLMR